MTLQQVADGGTEMTMPKVPPSLPIENPDSEASPEGEFGNRFQGIFDPNSPRLRLIAGDASDRKFYRYREGDATYICMQFPSWSGGYGGDPLSWLGMHRVLLAWNLPVPKIVHVDEDNACIWTSDLGDEFLNRDLGSLPFDASRNEHQVTFLRYREALELLIRAQYPPAAQRDLPHPAQSRLFDEQKLLFELNFFGEHFVKGLLSGEVSSSLLDEWTALASEIAGLERVLCHRDYHARNLMVAEGRLHWIDFQDARMGPHSYDVVSLLRDSYVRFDQATREQLFNDYFDNVNAARSRAGLEPLTAAGFHRERLMVGLQRNIKALGSFAYLHRVKRKKVYLSFVRHTLDVILSESRASEVMVKYPKTLALVQGLIDGPASRIFDAMITKEGLDQF